MALAAIAAREEIIRACLRRLSAERGDESNAHYSDEIEYADDLLDRAAAELTKALR